MSNEIKLPMAHFGAVGTPLPDPRIDPDGDFDPDDEELPESPPDVVMMLGFDPKDMDA
jgi:hypothetical protein